MPASRELEWKTRKARIGPKLDDAGWRLPKSAMPLHGAWRGEKHDTTNGPAGFLAIGSLIEPVEDETPMGKT